MSFPGRGQRGVDMDTPRRTREGRLTRREALGLLGATAGLGLAAGCRGGASAAQQIRYTSAAAPDFPGGAVIRTLRGDVAAPNSSQTGRR